MHFYCKCLPFFRELKPGNILLGDQGHAIITYFCQINQVNDYLDFVAMHNFYVAPGKHGIFDMFLFTFSGS